MTKWSNTHRAAVEAARCELVVEMKKYVALDGEMHIFNSELNTASIVWMRERIMFVRAWASVRGYSDLIKCIDTFKKKLNNEKI